TQASFDDTQAGWQSGQALLDFGNTAIYDDYPNGPPVVSGNAEITPVTIAARSSEAITGGLGLAAVNVVNGSGLASNGTHGTIGANNMWMSTGAALTPTDSLPAQISFDLGSVQNLTAIHVWNYNEFGASNLSTRGSKTVQILVRGDTTSTYTSVGTFTFDQATGLSSYAGQEIPFVQNGVRQIQFNITANWGAAGSVTGLSEVKFYNDQPAVAPAPPLRRESLAGVLPNTGVNYDGTLITPGQRDPHYVNLADNLGAFVENGNGAWLGVDGISQWVGPTASGNDSVPAISTTYRLTANLTNWKKETASILLSASVDNVFDRIRVNGTVIAGATASGFDRYYGPFTIPVANLINGVNTFELDWTNSGSTPNPGGFRAKWDATAVPLIQPLVKTSLATNPVTTRFRQKFTWNGNVSSTYALTLEHILDDGAVFYLNGQELLRTNLPAGAISNTTLASQQTLYPRFSGPLVVPAAAFHVGENTLAVELHQASVTDADALFGATLSLTETPAPLVAPPSLVISEIAAATSAAGTFFIEIQNTGGTALSLLGYSVKSSAGPSVTLGNLSIPAGGRLVLDEAALGFRLAKDDKVYLYIAGGGSVVDAGVAKNQVRARTDAGTWQQAAAATPGASNTFAISDSIVINEIMYAHAPVYLATGTVADPEEWVEIYNRGNAVVSLDGWSLKGGADFTFPVGTSIPAGGYLVVASDKLALAAKYPAITIVGNWSGGLSNSGDTVRIEDANGNTVNEVNYLTSGRWDERADAGGSTLELKHPGMDNSQPEAWTASDETSKAAWQNFSYSGLATPPASSSDPTTYNEFIAGMIAGGECLMDDVSVVDNTTGFQLIQNGNFTSGTADKWRLLGTHGGSSVVTVAGNPAHKISASGATEHMHNHIETTLRSTAGFVTIDPMHNYTISFKAKWQSGPARLQTRLYFNRLARQHLLQIPVNNGTPGAANSKMIAQPQPTLSGLSHSPVVPPAGLQAVVKVSAAQRVPVSSMTLKWQKDATTTWTDVPMSLNGSGQYEGAIPGQVAGTLVQFYVVALATNGTSVSLPAGGAASRAMIRWNPGNTQPTPGYSMRILMPTADSDSMHASTNVMSNAFLPCTIVYRDSEVFYDAGVHLKSSERGRLGDSRVGFSISFDPMQKLRGVHEGINMDRSAYGPGTTNGGTGQVDIINQVFANRAGGIPSLYNDMIYLGTPRTTHTGSVQMTMAEYNDIYLDSQWND
ncbi:MAG: hypothetical protein JWP97_6870, partial [Labilithrix sp.]|nr:hypothetical protein [Labilithrix sp.]